MSSKPTNWLRSTAAITITDVIRKLDPNQLVRSCISCDHFVEAKEACKISDMQRPPARVIAFGCPKYECLDDDIPF